VLMDVAADRATDPGTDTEAEKWAEHSGFGVVRSQGGNTEKQFAQARADHGAADHLVMARPFDADLVNSAAWDDECPA